MAIPNPDSIFPNLNIKSMTNIKPTITNPNIQVGNFTYFGDIDFEKHVTHHYDFIGDKLIIGKFCQIAAGVNFIMNGANHQMNAVSTFPFYIFDGWEQTPPPQCALPLKGDTIVGNDVWIGQNATILPGVHIGDGAIIGLNSVVGNDVEPYSIVAGNPAKLIRKRFDDELIQLLEKLQWWNWNIDEIQSFIPVLTDSHLDRVKSAIKNQLHLPYSASQTDSHPIVRQITEPSIEEFQQIAEWMFQWWGIVEGYSMEEIHCYLKHSFNSNTFPQTYGLFLGKLLIGCFQFTLNDFELRPDIYPWLANLYIDKKWRGMGYGNILINGAKSIAHNTLPYKTLFLYTEHTGLYEHFGFQFVEDFDTFKKVPRIQRLYKLVLSP